MTYTGKATGIVLQAQDQVQRQLLDGAEPPSSDWAASSISHVVFVS